MSPKKGDRVSVPPLSGWNAVFGTTEAVTGREELCRVALSSAHRCLEALRTDPQSRDRWNRQHQLRGRLATKEWKGSALDQGSTRSRAAAGSATSSVRRPRP